MKRLRGPLAFSGNQSVSVTVATDKTPSPKQREVNDSFVT